MATAVPANPTVKPRGLARIFAWRRVRFTLIVATIFGLMFSAESETSAAVWIARTWIVGLSVLFMFGLFEQWPQRISKRLARWVLQLIAIVVVIPRSMASRVASGASFGLANALRSL